MREDEILRNVEGPEVLDVGCAGHQVRLGHPNWLHGRLRERFHVTGIDSSESNIALLRSLGFENVYRQNAEDFNLDRSFNTIVAGEVLEHLSNPGRFLGCAWKHLLPGGRLVLTTPYSFSLMYWFYAMHHFPRTCQNGEHTSWFCPRTLGELARREGFAVERLCLTDDYDPSVRSTKYRLYWACIRSISGILPERMMRTTILAVLRRSDEKR